MIEFHPGLLANPQKLTELLSALGSRIAVIVSEELRPLYGESVPGAHIFTFPGGESSKTRETKERLEDQMFAKGLGRDTCLVAIGGGVTTDLAGYIASTYCRGIPLVMIPTSLLAMVDASIGGKTGVNTPFGKNLIGSFYQPKKILIDTAVLKTLPLRELRNGIVEMIKHGVIADRNYFEFLASYKDDLFSLTPDILLKAIQRSCEIKKEIVNEDVKENGKRRFLNFGHTIAHALESLSDYTLPHGEAVAIGMVVESEIAVKLGHLSKKSAETIEHLLMAYGLPLHLPFSLSEEALLKAMVLDKKSVAGKPRFILLEEIGKPLDCLFVEEEILKSVWRSKRHHLSDASQKL
jgi:3-dehydroquinate synthase